MNVFLPLRSLITKSQNKPTNSKTFSFYFFPPPSSVLSKAQSLDQTFLFLDFYHKAPYLLPPLELAK